MCVIAKRSTQIIFYYINLTIFFSKIYNIIKKLFSLFTSSIKYSLICTFPFYLLCLLWNKWLHSRLLISFPVIKSCKRDNWSTGRSLMKWTDSSMVITTELTDFIKDIWPMLSCARWRNSYPTPSCWLRVTIKHLSPGWHGSSGGGSHDSVAPYGRVVFILPRGYPSQHSCRLARDDKTVFVSEVYYKITVVCRANCL